MKFVNVKSLFASASILGVLATTVISATPVFADDGLTATGKATVNIGPGTSSITADRGFDFGSKPVGDATDLPDTLKPTLTVNDMSGNGAGWNVKVELTGMKSGDHPLTGATVDITPDAGTASNGGSVATNAGAAPTLTNIDATAGNSGTAATLITADKDTGLNTSAYVLTAKLHSGAQAYSGTYTGTLTYTLQLNDPAAA